MTVKSVLCALCGFALLTWGGAGVASAREGTVREALMDAPRIEICLNGTWQTHDGGTADEPPSGDWREVRVPEEFGDWSRESAWYRLTFNVPGSFAGKRVELEIWRILFYGKVLVNGRLVGESWQPRVPLTADITDAVTVGKENELLVYVHCLAEGYSNPGEPLKNLSARGALIPYYDQADMAGIFGDVYLRAHPAVHVSDLQVITSVQKKELGVRAWVANKSKNHVEAVLKLSALRAGKTELELPEVTVGLAPGEARGVETSAAWESPVLWGPPPFGEPVLYHLKSEVVVEGEPVDVRFDRFGFRELWIEGNRFLFNGRPAFLMGTHISGFEMREAMSLLVPKLQQAGFLVVHPHADNRLPAFYDVCDEMGMLVWDCTFCGGPIGNAFGRWEGDRRSALSSALPYLEDVYRKWVRLNRNHPSVVIWSAGCGNHEVNEHLEKVILEEDASRPVTGYHTPEAPQEVKMFGFPGWQGQEPDYSKGKQAIQQELKNRGDRQYPLWICEYWSQSGRPEAMEITYDMGVAGGCTFDVGGYRGSLPPMTGNFTISWPSLSGRGQRRQNLYLRGHKKTFPEFRHPNWCDPTKPVWRGQWSEEAGYRAVAEKAGVTPGIASERVPEVIVTLTRAGKPVAHEYVYVLPQAGQSANPVGVMTDAAGTAWFVLPEPGKYRAVSGDLETTFDTSRQPLKQAPGYHYIQQVRLGD